MGEHRIARRQTVMLALALVLGAALVAVSPLTAAERNAYTVTSLVSDQQGVATHTDGNLVNAWGLTAGPTTPWWVSDNGTNKSTLYGGDGAPRALVVTVAGGPTGTVFNSTSAFLLPTGGKALFLFDGEDGVVRGWNGAQGTTAIVVKDRSDVGAIYKGLSIADTAAGPRLYAADFHNTRVDVFNGSFGLVPNSGFVDPGLPAGYAPFNVQTIGDRVFVAYAKQDEDAHDEIAGQGRGFVDAYDTQGNLLDRVAQHGQLNAPWGLALAPASFGRFGGDLLVGNFGDGNINAYDPRTGSFKGKLMNRDANVIDINGLWALRFGNGVIGTPQTLLFSAGIGDEDHGLLGEIVVRGSGE